MSFTASLIGAVKVAETLTVGIADIAANTIIPHTAMDLAPLGLDSTTTPPLTEYSGNNIALITGAKTIDLTSLVGTGGRAVTLNGLKPYFIVFRNRGANDMTIVIGASNGYTGLGASFSLVVKAGYEVRISPSSLSPTGSPTAVSSTVKTLDVTGTGSQAFDFQVGAGA